MAVDFDLTLFIKETQLQHGLRAEDYVRYHHYTTNRLATLRRQLSLSNDKKKFLYKEVTPQNATDARHLMLLALYAERCWAEAEAMQAQLQAKKESRSTDANKPKGGVPPQDQYRKRLNKSVKWASKLHEVAKEVASDRVTKECSAYLKDTAGRCYASHGKFKEAKEAFLEARETYATLRSVSSESGWVVIALHAVCSAGKLFFTGESWRLSEAWSTAMKYYCDALALLREVKGSLVASMQEHIEQRLMQGAAEVVLAASSMGAGGNARRSTPLMTYLVDAGEETTQVAQGVVRFPPDYRAAPCKPVFVDVASTFLDYPVDSGDEADSDDRSGAKTATVPAMKNASAAAGQPKKKDWMFGWRS